MQFLESKIALYGKYKYEVNLFDVYIQIEQGKSTAKYFVQFIEKIISDIKNVTSI